MKALTTDVKKTLPKTSKIDPLADVTQLIVTSKDDSTTQYL